MNWLERILKNVFNVFISKLGLILKLGQLIGHLVTNIFIEKVYKKYAQKTSNIRLFNFGK